MKETSFKKQFATTITACLAFLILSLAPAAAHFAWVTSDNYSPMPGDEITIDIAWGHKFPGDGRLGRQAYEYTKLEIIDPEGQRKTVTVMPEEEKGNKPVKIKMEKQGNHTILLTQKTFSSKTTKGYKAQPKNELENVLVSRWSETVSKSVVTAGPAEKGFSNGDTGDRFQIFPLENPLKLEKNEFLPVKVTLDGKPWGGKVYATYEGFTDMADTFAYTTVTDKEGVARIKMLEKGLWLIMAEHSYPYEDTKKADEYALKATLTFKN